MIYFDTETIGFEGPIVLIQYAEDDGPIELHNVWYSPIKETLSLIEWMCYHEEGICGFNLSFDWFHICQTYTTLNLLQDEVPMDELPIDHIDQYAICEERARIGPCCKPVTAFDLMLHARKGPYQTTMPRKDIVIKRVPTQIAYTLAKELDQRIPLNDVYFEKNRDPSKRWRIRDVKDEEDNPVPEFKNVVLAFNPSSALKALAKDALGYEASKVLKFEDLQVGDTAKPRELAYAPFAMALGKPGSWKRAWPAVCAMHAKHWEYREMARRYAEDDVKYTRGLERFFRALHNGHDKASARLYGRYEMDLDCPNRDYIGDVDSLLACMVGAVRWRGFAVDLDQVKRLKAKNERIIQSAPGNFNSYRVVATYLKEVLKPEEQVVMQVNGKFTTKTTVLEEICKWCEEDVCPKCEGMGCEDCSDSGLIKDPSKPHPAAERANEVLAYRRAGKRIDVCQKLLKAGRFHVSMKVIGTLSSRMAGGNDEQSDSGKLNPQGIQHEHEVRDCFPLCDEGYELEGGDFSSFEVVLMDAAYKDPDLHELLLEGKKIHAIFGTFLFSGYDYDEIKATDGLPGEKDLYTRSKKGVFALAYGGDEGTLHNRVGISIEQAADACARWNNRFKTFAEERQKIFDDFCSMRQPGGIGTQVVWHDPKDYVESLLGFRRWFTLENMIVKELYSMANKLPASLKGHNFKVKRRDREQVASGAVQTALYAAAFNTQAANMRAAGNHIIQSTGAELTKILQARLWGFQPFGIGDFVIIPFNIHDEIMAPTLEKAGLSGKILEEVNSFVQEYKKQVPLLAIDWKDHIPSWADKG